MLSALVENTFLGARNHATFQHHYEVSPNSRRHLKKGMTISELDEHLVEMKYAVRGKVVDVADQMQAKLAAGEDLPFKEMVFCNIGNPHAVKQKPITFYRQVAACLAYPALCEDSGTLSEAMPADVKKRANEYLASTGGNGVGSYTGSTGLKLVRQQVAAFIEARDGYKADPESIELHTGASEGVKRVIQAVIAKDTDVMMIPMPQYPLYSAALTMCGGKAQYYMCDEDKDWSVTRDELERSWTEGENNGTHDVRAIAVINPGNPTGAVMSEEEVKTFITFARDKELPILADEVYQTNVYSDGKEFHSFKKVLRKLQDEDTSYAKVQLMSFHSVSKGIIGECGFRGGYTEFVGMSDNVMKIFTKVASTSLSSNTLGQCMVGMMVTPPKEGDPSYALFKQETEGIFDGLKERAKLLTDGLNSIPGISSRAIQGAMYAFANVEIRQKAIDHAQQDGVAADEFWCVQLVEQTGIVCVPGSGFGQKPGTYHFRITILPPTEQLKGMLERLRNFHTAFTAHWSSFALESVPEEPCIASVA